jgi:hypothetical protein
LANQRSVCAFRATARKLEAEIVIRKAVKWWRAA